MQNNKNSLQEINIPLHAILPLPKKNPILSMGAESSGNFSVYKNGVVYFSKDFGDLLDENNFKEFQKELNKFLKKNRVEPRVILTDLHPLYKTNALGEKLAKKFKAKHIGVQHHLAHIFSSIGDNILNMKNNYIPENIIGVALDGTGYGTDNKIWGGEIFKISNHKLKTSNKKRFLKSTNGLRMVRIGHLENQFMIGGDLAVKEPARMIIAILEKSSQYKYQKEHIYNFVKKHYTKKKFDLLYNQLQNNFNCIETSSAGRILDATAIILKFADNTRKFKHESAYLLEKNSSKPYSDLKPKIKKIKTDTLENTSYELCTTFLFEYLIKNIKRNKKRLSATAQLYIARGLYEIIKKNRSAKMEAGNLYLAGGISNNKIISSFLKSKGFYINKKIPRGDAGISFGQIMFYAFSE